MPQTPTPSNPITDYLFAHITKIGVAGGIGYFGCQVAIAKDWRDAVNSLGYLFLMLIPAGGAFASKKTNDIIVSSEAEKRIADPAMTGPSATVPQSVVPAIAREIIKQQEAPSGTTTN